MKPTTVEEPDLATFVGSHGLLELFEQQRRDLVESLTRLSMPLSGQLGSLDQALDAQLVRFRQAVGEDALADARNALMPHYWVSSALDVVATVQPGLLDAAEQQRRELIESINRASVLPSSLLDSLDRVGNPPLAALPQSMVDGAFADAQRALTFVDTASSFRDAWTGIQPRFSELVEASCGQLRSLIADASHGSALAALRDQSVGALALLARDHVACPSIQRDRAWPGRRGLHVARRPEHPDPPAPSSGLAAGEASAQTDWVEACAQACKLIEQFLGLVPTLVMARNITPAQIVDSLQPRGGLEGRAWSLAMAFCQLWRVVHAFPDAEQGVDALDAEAVRALALADAVGLFRRSLWRYLGG